MVATCLFSTTDYDEFLSKHVTEILGYVKSRKKWIWFGK